VSVEKKDCQTVAVDLLNKLDDGVSFPESVKPLVTILHIHRRGYRMKILDIRMVPRHTDMDPLADYYIHQGCGGGEHPEDLFGPA
jgi:hypothetical protein